MTPQLSVSFQTTTSLDPIQSPLTDSDEVTYVDIAEKLTLLNLSVYTPLNYILPVSTSLCRFV